VAGVEQTEGGGYALTFPRRLGYGLRDTVVSLSWRTGDDLVVSRTDARNPVAYINLDGVNSDGPTRNLLMPVTTVAANPSAVYVADDRGVIQLSASSDEGEPGWTEVRPLMAAGALPVLPG
ncbi:MAG: LpqB family beta-propeller domain-containing protein, partial [Mycobacterium sp.]|nr:LpqB family beta-propeller domain-containing protein [Mycobacterium sp.]